MDALYVDIQLTENQIRHHQELLIQERFSQYNPGQQDIIRSIMIAGMRTAFYPPDGADHVYDLMAQYLGKDILDDIDPEDAETYERLIFTVEKEMGL